MTGWHVSVYPIRQGEMAGADPTGRIAVWQTNWDGLDWLDRLVKQKHATVTGNGYPLDYITTIGHVRDAILTGPPHALAIWKSEPGDILSANWAGRTVVNREALRAAGASDNVLVRAWDES